MNDDPVPYSRCRELAGAIRSSPGWRRRVRACVRPRGVTWFIRSRAPLAAQLYLAGQQGRLLTHGDRDCALVEPPAAAPVPGTSTLAVLDRYWDLLVFGVPPVLLLLTSLPLAVVRARTACLVLIALALLWVVALMAATVIRQILLLTTGRRRLVETAVGQLRTGHLTVGLLHAPSGPGAARDLISYARRGTQPGNRRVLVLSDGISAHRPARRGAGGLCIEPLSDLHPLLVAYRTSDSRWDLPPPVPGFRGRQLGLVLGGSAAIVALLAEPVAAEERRLCGEDCSDVPATAGDAVYWLLSRMTGGDPEGLGVASPGNRVLGLLMTVYGVWVLVGIVGQVIQQRIDEDSRSGRDVVADFEAARVRAGRGGRPRPAGRS